MWYPGANNQPNNLLPAVAFELQLPSETKRAVQQHVPSHYSLKSLLFMLIVWWFLITDLKVNILQKRIACLHVANNTRLEKKKWNTPQSPVYRKINDNLRAFIVKFWKLINFDRLSGNYNRKTFVSSIWSIKVFVLVSVKIKARLALHCSASTNVLLRAHKSLMAFWGEQIKSKSSDLTLVERLQHKTIIYLLIYSFECISTRWHE